MIGKRITQAGPADDKPWVGSCDISAASTSHNGGACGAVSQVRVRDEDSYFSDGRSTLNLLLVLPRPCMATTHSRQYEWGQGCWDLVHIGEAKWNTCLFSQRVCQRTYQFGKMLAGYALPSNVTRAIMHVKARLLHHSLQYLAVAAYRFALTLLGRQCLQS